MPTLTPGGAAAPGPVTPQRDDARELGSSAGTKGDRTADSADCAGADDPAQPQPRKDVATLRALLALAGGHAVHELAGGGFLVAWRGHQRHCHDLAELEAHARRVGALK